MAEAQYHWLAFTQLLDSAFPIGGFAHSFGLETLVQEGAIRSPEDLREYICGLLHHSWAPSDALGVKAAYVYSSPDQADRLWEVDRLLHLQRAPREAREGSQKMGRRLLALGRSVHPGLAWDPLQSAVADGTTPGTHPIVHGYTARLLGVPLRIAAEGFLYMSMQMAVNSALRLMPIGQTQAQALLAECIPLVGEAWLEVADLGPEECRSFAPLTEVAMMRHETLYSRLFMS